MWSCMATKIKREGVKLSEFFTHVVRFPAYVLNALKPRYIFSCHNALLQCIFFAYWCALLIPYTYRYLWRENGVGSWKPSN